MRAVIFASVAVLTLGVAGCAPKAPSLPSPPSYGEPKGTIIVPRSSSGGITSARSVTVTSPDVIGKPIGQVAGQPENCYYRLTSGRLDIAPCPPG